MVWPVSSDKWKAPLDQTLLISYIGNFESTKKCFLTCVHSTLTSQPLSIILLNPNFGVAIVLEIENNSHSLKLHLKKFF